MRERAGPLRSVLLSCAGAVLFAACGPSESAAVTTPPAVAPAPEPSPAPQPPAAEPLHGRIEDLGNGLKLLRVWGTASQRGYAHGLLMGKEVAAVATAEFQARFARQKGLLDQARAAVGRLIEYPADARAAIEGLWRGLGDSGADLVMPELDRSFDLQDLLVANALDVFGLMGCSGFTAWGERVDGGGVLTGRNFDWPFTGDHLLDGTIVLVEHLPSGRAVAAVTWPGYLGVVTGVSSEGVAAFLHVGSAQISMTPEPSSWPTAVAARAILENTEPDDGGAKSFAAAAKLLEYTSPPAGYLTRVILPAVPPDDVPVGLFETDVHGTQRTVIDGPSIVTNHFLGRKDGRKASKDSTDRESRIRTGLESCFTTGDSVVSVAEGWEMLQSVQRGGGHAFGTLHSLVFRNDPWCFELRIGVHAPKGLVAAPASERRFALARERLFPTAIPGAPR